MEHVSEDARRAGSVPSSGAPVERVSDVVGALPLRAADSLRRVSSLAISPAPEWQSGVRIDAVAADLVVGPEAGGRESVPLRRVELTVGMDGDSRIERVGGDLAAEVVRRIVGKSPVSGFRGHLASLAGEGLDPHSLQGAILDDLPTVRLIAGYARMIEAPPPRGVRTAPVLNICRGWAEGSTADRRSRAGEALVLTTPAAPPLERLLADPGDFVGEAPLAPRSMRRRRILELVRNGPDIEVFEYFRDSHVDEHGVEGSLHEYVVSARVDSSLVIRALRVEPRALPFPECPLASPNAGALIGARVRDVAETVRERLTGTSGCTHLNDVLRFLRFVEPLVVSLPMPQGENR